MILSFLKLSAIIVTASSTDICYTFSTEERYAVTSTCGAAVDYSFYLKSGTILLSLENDARVLLKEPNFLISSSACLVNYKKLVCSSVYMKCQPGLIMNNNSTYNKNIYPNHPVPFTRPCKQVCTNVVQSCAGLFQPNCSAVMDYSGGKVSLLPKKFDTTNDPLMCNSVPAVFAVAGASEPYLQKEEGACAGLVTDVFIPPGSLISPFLTYLTSPYVIQTVIESSLAKSFSQLPVSTSADCHFAFRKYFCGSFMLKPQSQKVSTALLTMGIDPSLLYINSSLLDTTFYLPQFPDASVCSDYATKCKVFLELANVTALQPQCNGKIPGTESKKFPVGPQIVNYVVLPLVYKNVSKPVTYSPIYLFSSPNTFSGANDANYVTRCPTGFVVPDHPDDPRAVLIPGTGCAFACRFPIWTVGEYKLFDALIKVLCAIGLPMVLYFVISSLMDPKLRKTQYLRICYASTAIGLSVYVLGMADSPDKYFCKDNAISYNIIYDGATVCTVQAVLFLYGGLLNAVAWMMISLDLYFKIVLGAKTTYHHLPYHFVMIYILPAIFTAGVASSGIEFGYTDTSSAICSMSSKDYKDVYFFYIPILVFSLIGLIAGLRVVFSIFFTISNSPSMGKKDMNRFLILRTPLFFLLVFITLWCAAFAFRTVIFRDKDEIMASVVSWTMCVFKNYTGTDSSWQDVCGIAAPNRISVSFNIFVLSFISGQGIIITLIFKCGSIYTTAVKFICRSNTNKNSHMSPSVSNSLLGTTTVKEAPTKVIGPNTAIVNSHGFTFNSMNGQSVKTVRTPKDKNPVGQLDRSSVRMGLSSVRIRPENILESPLSARVVPFDEADENMAEKSKCDDVSDK